MPCRSIADILRGMGETPPSERESVSDPPVSSWVDPARIQASTAQDVLWRRDDDRSRAERSEQSAAAVVATRVTRKFRYKFGAQTKARANRPKLERTPEVKEYFRQYQRERENQ